MQPTLVVNVEKHLLPSEWRERVVSGIIASLSSFPEIEKIILFGSFITSDAPNDIDIAVFQNSDENYLTLSLKYRKALRSLGKVIPLDVLPLKKGSHGLFIQEEITQGKVIYEKGD